ncbi:YdcF family protein [Sporosarcina beigongshangi]|uniref:YdcF family protein n=1 Tax=Sporosarcina beigongshangi TaxID=2782538 RepID=UPI001939DAE3|nr:YdcF family protein [Sporosarcina beigongshangi]
MTISQRKIVLACLVVVAIGIFCWWRTGKWITAGMEPVADGTNDYAIVLGAKVKQDSLSLSLRYRLDAALDYANEHPHVTLILSGGQGPDEPMSEAEAMRQFLTDNGIEESRLLLEDASTSTYENILFSKKLLPADVDSITIISSDFHLARAQKIAGSLDLQSDVVAAQTPKVVEAKSNFRERLALVKTFILGK